jgi:exodeoxyribonuclease X
MIATTPLNPRRHSVPTTEPTAQAILFDTETTTTGDTAEIIEAAWRGVRLRFLDTESPDVEAGPITSERFAPKGPISLGAMATHHIIPEDLVTCRPSAEFRLPEETAYAIGHNIDFDWRVAGKPDLKRICTLALARRLWPSLDSHSQSALLYYLLPASEARLRLQAAHSATIDVMNLSPILGRIVDELAPTSWDELHRMSEDARIPIYMPFGKHKPPYGQEGTKIIDLPRDYLQWLVRQPDMDPYVVTAAKRALA